ncbi:Alpha-N-acetylgalactosaminide alpha-2,6-sialyltransferase 2, partial [Goodea atripinnis]
VSAYGFITRNYLDFSDHYYDSVPRPLRFYANHDLQLESRLWEALHRRSVLWLFQRGGGQRGGGRCPTVRVVSSGWGQASPAAVPSSIP